MDIILWFQRMTAADASEPYGEGNWRIDRFPEFTANKTIRILFSNKNWLPAFEKKNYEQYGVVRLRRYDKEENHLRCLIEFEDKSVVDKIISDGHIYINDNRINIEAMSVLDSDPAHMINHLVVQPWNDNGPQLNGDTFKLDNDCLLFIFRKLHLRTLWSLADTCVRFNEVAKGTFRLKYRRKLFRFCDVFTNYPIPLQQIAAFLRMFGSSIEKIFISPHEFDDFSEYRLNDVLRLINENCPDLKVLDMRKIVVDHSVWNECLPLFVQLQTLNVTFADNDMNQLQPTVLPNLTSFKITTRNYCHMKSFLLNDWPLEELSVYTFPQVESRFVDPKTEANWSYFFRLICEHCASIKKLSIRPITSVYNQHFAMNTMRLNEFKHLRHLQLNFNWRTVEPLLERMLQSDIQLEYLQLERADIGEDGADVISQFKRIETLKLVRNCRYTFDCLVGLVKRMPSLSKLCFCASDIWFEPILDHVDMVMPLVLSGTRLSNLVVVLTEGFGEYADEKFEELLAIVKKRLIPIKLKVEFITVEFGPHTITHFAEKKSKPDLLTVEATINHTDSLEDFR